MKKPAVFNFSVWRFFKSWDNVFVFPGFAVTCRHVTRLPIYGQVTIVPAKLLSLVIYGPYYVNHPSNGHAASARLLPVGDNGQRSNFLFVRATCYINA